MLLAAGEVLRGKYRIERVLGRGGMGVVVEAEHLRLSRRVALKLLTDEAKGRPEIVERFAQEAKVASRLRGEHIVRVLDVDDSESGDPFLVMELLEGTDMLHHLAAQGPLPIATAVDYVLQACEGVAEAHAASIVHRDLKPANLFLTTRPDGTELLKVLDFGISKIDEVDTSASHGITKPDSAIGSPSYMSPEQIKNARSVDERADLWALGVVLFQFLTNELPFTADTSAALAARIAADEPRSLRALRDDVPAALADVVTKCLAKSPADRYADVAALARALSPFASSSAATADRIARVLVAAPRRVDATPMPISGPPTTSLHGAPRLGLERAMLTEAPSIVTREPTLAPRRAWGPVLLGAVVIAAFAIGVVALVRRPTLPASPASAAAPSLPPPPETIATSTASTPPASAVVASPSLPASSVPLASSVPPARRHPPPARSVSPRNPMDLDFQ